MSNPSGSARSRVEWIAVTIDCADEASADRMRTFYAAALGGEMVQGSVRARGLLFAFQALPNYRPPTWPSEVAQIHFELVVPDLDEALTWLQELGASLASYHDPNDVGLRVMLDPAGHPFCVIAASSVAPAFRDETHFPQS